MLKNFKPEDPGAENFKAYYLAWFSARKDIVEAQNRLEAQNRSQKKMFMNRKYVKQKAIQVSARELFFLRRSNKMVGI
ncbi:MAG: hypothetical protein PHF18_12060 [Methanosarcina sp.]|uniref:hypothetical protein n=1 Tax=Methanosarcina sp. TaxID=2213 RepID=UPI00260B2DD2|nr:hypothetical protein [Methanosarcina sp.]MDD3247567.1 hypothetical protein [Methanosarcina sp.]MDD4249353.1 hypothetical protein [Methanosarcina sp.]